MKSGIYKITNKYNGKIYIGGSVNIQIRFSSHIRKLQKNTHENSYLQRAYNCSWTNPFIFETIEICDKSLLKEREQYWLDLTDCCNPSIGYNLFKFARSALGHIQTEDHKRKISESNKGKTVSIEVRQKISIKNKGYKHTEEAKKLISLASKRSKRILGRKLTDDHKLKLSIAGKGKFGKNRNFKKWPHELGHKCKCNECKRVLLNEKYAAKRLRNFNRITLNVNNIISSHVLASLSVGS